MPERTCRTNKITRRRLTDEKKDNEITGTERHMERQTKKEKKLDNEGENKCQKKKEEEEEEEKEDKEDKEKEKEIYGITGK